MKILVVDDEEMMIKTIEFHLKKLGHEVITSSDGKEAMDKIEQETPDLIISDIMMPFMSGFELLSIVKTDPNKKIPVMLISSLDEIQVIDTAIEIGADDFIIKPINLNELTLRVNRFSHKSE